MSHLRHRKVVFYSSINISYTKMNNNSLGSVIINDIASANFETQLSEKNTIELKSLLVLESSH